MYKPRPSVKTCIKIGLLNPHDACKLREEMFVHDNMVKYNTFYKQSSDIYNFILNVKHSRNKSVIFCTIKMKLVNRQNNLDTIADTRANVNVINIMLVKILQHKQIYFDINIYLKNSETDFII